MNEPNAPKLIGDMIPVTYNGTNWVKADINKNNWYDYNRGVWANAVTIKDANKRAEYKTAAVGTTIDLNYVNLMLVWIPRYSYTLRQSYGYQIEGGSTPSINTPGAFDIKFVDTNTTEKGTGKYTGTTPTDYFTPSSFCWGNSCDVESTRGNSGNIELSGIWISKFELTGSLENIESKPNQTSMINKNISSFFNSIKDKMNSTNGLTKYGLNGNYDTHMIKNTEWGAFAYLSQSKYGKYGNSNYTNANKEIYINDYIGGNEANVNDYNGYITGCSKGAPSSGNDTFSNSSNNCLHHYNENILGTGASTTGTIYGIYDVSGGSLDLVMGNFNNKIGGSGFSTMPERKYYNLYTGTTGIKGDSTNADGTAGFYGDYKYFTYASYPWFRCGGLYRNGVIAGVFYFERTLGEASPIHGSRLAISTW